MDSSIPVPVHPSNLARAITALANSGGGCFIVETKPEKGRKTLATALTEILPRPVFSGTSGSVSPKEKTQLQINGIVRPATVTIREEENGMIVTVTPGGAFSSLKGEVLVFEGGTIRALTIKEVVRKAGSGG